MPSHDQIKYAKDALSVAFMLLVGTFLFFHFVRGGTFGKGATFAGAAA